MGETAGSRRLELRIELHDGKGSVDLAVQASSAHTVRELCRRAAGFLGAAAADALWCERRNELLPSETTLDAAAIRWGDRLRVVGGGRAATDVDGAARCELVVTAGPCAGRRWMLAAGTYSLGRGPECDICIPDPSLSRHHLDLAVDGEIFVVTDVGSANGTAIDGDALPAHTERRLRMQDELEMGRTMISLRPLAAQTQPALLPVDGRIEFNRPPRVPSRSNPFKRELPAPPSRGRKARLPLAASLMPLGAGLMLFLLLKSPVMLAVAGLTPLMAIGSYVGERRGGRKSFAKASADFRRQVEQAAAEFDQALTSEATQRRAESPDAPTLISRVRDLDSALWERRPADADFLRLRLGVADLPSRGEASIAKGGDEELRSYALSKLGERRTVSSVPVTVDLLDAGVLGLAGARQSTMGLARWLVLQAAILHSPGDLVLVALLSEQTWNQWSWLKWLPHLRADRLGLDISAVAAGRGQGERALVEVRELVASRAKQSRAVDARNGAQPQLLLLIDEDACIDRGLVTAALSNATPHGICALWLGRDARDLPGQTGAIVEASHERAVVKLTDVSTGACTDDVSVDAMSSELAEEVGRMLAPLRDASELAGAGSVPRRVGLVELLELMPLTREALERRWSRWQDGLRFTVGVDARGPLAFDLRDEGPHALIAGTTGSGKSELLRTIVASAAATVPPDRLAFLLIDYKGGAAFAPCARLPHVVDVVSDLDEHVAERALVSLNAELKRRERILAEHGARDMLELIRRDRAAAPAMLVIAVDEFAKLREEIPEFVDGVVDIAQRGRSLGVHMVLAAQTLRNAFTPAIRANTNLRIALRVADEAESEDVIASPLAGRIPSGESYRGRAFARTGSGEGELRELQSAYVSGRSAQTQLGEIQVQPFELVLLDSPGSGGADQEADSDLDSDLTALGEAAQAAKRSMGLRTPAPPWLPMLPSLLGLDSLDRSEARPGQAPIGLVDRPQLQRQEPLMLDLAETGHVAVFGCPGSGRTTALTSIALSLAEATSPERLRIYALDAASGALACLAALPHCAAVLDAGEEERIERLFRELLRQIERRTATRRGQEGTPEEAGTIVLLLDDLGSFAHRHDRPGLDSPYESLRRVLAGGRAASVHVVLTAARRGELPASLAAHVGQQLVLRMQSEDEMRALGLDPRAVRGAQLPPGRGFTKDGLEFQIAVPISDGSMVAVQRAAAGVRGDRDHQSAIGVLPADVLRASLEPASGIDCVPLGIADEDLDLATVDLADLHLLIAGPYRSGRSTALQTLAIGLREAEPNASIHLLAPRRSPLRDLDLWSSIASSADDCAKTVTALLDELETRESKEPPALLLIDDAGELAGALLLSQLERLVKSGRDRGMRVIAAAETAAARGIGLGWIRELRREEHGLLLQPDLAADGDLLGVRLPRRLAVPLPPGRGFLVKRNRAELVQVAR